MKRIPWGLAALALAALCAGCGGNPKSNPSAAAASSAVSMSADQAGQVMGEGAENNMTATDLGALSPGTGGPALPPSVDVPENAGRKIVWQVRMSLETLQFDTSVGAITDAVRAAQGYIESSSIDGSSLDDYGARHRRAGIVARIPHKELDAFLGTVSQNGNVVSVVRESEDITLQYADTQTRKKSLQVEQERLLALLEKAEDMKTILALQTRLSELRYELDSLSSELRGYDSLVDYSTVTMELAEVTRVTPPPAQTFGARVGAGFSDTLRHIKNGAEDFVVWFVVNLPYLLIWAAIIAAALAVARAVMRRHAKQSASAPMGKEDKNSDQNLKE